MRIRLQRSGGFAAVPGLGVDVEVDTTALPPDVAEPLEGAAHAARSELEVAPDQTEAGRRDAFTYDLEIEDSAGITSARFTDPLPTPAVRDLVGRLQQYRPALGDPS